VAAQKADKKSIIDPKATSTVPGILSTPKDEKNKKPRKKPKEVYIEGQPKKGDIKEKKSSQNFWQRPGEKHTFYDDARPPTRSERLKHYTPQLFDKKSANNEKKISHVPIVISQNLNRVSESQIKILAKLGYFLMDPLKISGQIFITIEPYVLAQLSVREQRILQRFITNFPRFIPSNIGLSGVEKFVRKPNLKSTEKYRFDYILSLKPLGDTRLLSQPMARKEVIPGLTIQFLEFTEITGHKELDYFGHLKIKESSTKPTLIKPHAPTLDNSNFTFG
jgi:hypothetical protein